MAKEKGTIEGGDRMVWEGQGGCNAKTKPDVDRCDLQNQATEERMG